MNVFQSDPDFILAAIASVDGSGTSTQPPTDPTTSSKDPTTDLASDKVEDVDSGKVFNCPNLLIVFTVLFLCTN